MGLSGPLILILFCVLILSRVVPDISNRGSEPGRGRDCSSAQGVMIAMTVDIMFRTLMKVFSSEVAKVKVHFGKVI